MMEMSKREGCQVPLTNIGSVVPESTSLRHVCFVLSDSTIASPPSDFFFLAGQSNRRGDDDDFSQKPFFLLCGC